MYAKEFYFLMTLIQIDKNIANRTFFCEVSKRKNKLQKFPQF